MNLIRTRKPWLMLPLAVLALALLAGCGGTSDDSGGGGDGGGDTKLTLVAYSTPTRS